MWPLEIKATRESVKASHALILSTDILQRWGQTENLRFLLFFILLTFSIAAKKDFMEKTKQNKTLQGAYHLYTL